MFRSTLLKFSCVVLATCLLGGCMGYLTNGRQVEARVTIGYDHPFLNNKISSISGTGDVGNVDNVVYGVEYSNFDLDFYESTATSNVNGDFSTFQEIEINYSEVVNVDHVEVVGDYVANEYATKFYVSLFGQACAKTEVVAATNYIIVDKPWSDYASRFWGKTINIDGTTRTISSVVAHPVTPDYSFVYLTSNLMAPAADDVDVKVDGVLIDWTYVSSNDAVKWTQEVSYDIENNGVSKMALEIAQWSKSFETAKITSFTPRRTETYLSDRIKNLSLSEEIEAEERPFVGGAIAKVGRVELLNNDGLFTDRDDLKKNRLIIVEFSDGTTWTPMGKFYTSTWNSKDNFSSIVVSYQDLLGVLSDVYLTSDIIATSTSMQDLIEDVRDEFSQYIAEINFIHVTTLAISPGSSKIEKGISAFNALDLCAKTCRYFVDDGSTYSSLAVCYTNKYGIISFNWSKTTSGNKSIKDSEYFNFKLIKNLHSDFNRIIVTDSSNVKYSGYITNAYEETGDLQLSKNSLIVSSTIANHVLNNLLTQYYFENYYKSQYITLDWVGSPDFEFFKDYAIYNTKLDKIYFGDLIANDYYFDGGLRVTSRFKIWLIE